MSNTLLTVSPEIDRLGQVLCFVSAKGGTGKTILSATAAYLLMRSDMRVLVIDADFSTRGLSLYLLGSILQSGDLIIRQRNCLAEAVLSEIKVEEVEPLSLLREGIAYQAIISNEKVWKGGVPDDRFLGGVTSSGSEMPPLVINYYNFLNKLCKRFRKEFDYIIIDTRGGYDFTSAAPALVADGYIVVIEADKISVEQVAGFKEKIDEFANMIGDKTGDKKEAFLKGFIINKAIFSPEDMGFPEDLLRRYEAKTFGVIPFDRNAIRAYQLKDVPLSFEKYQDSNFCFYTLKALGRVFSPDLNWRDRHISIKMYDEFASHVRFLWRNRQRVESAQARAPYLLFALVLVATAFYFIYKIPGFAWALNASYILMASFILAAVANAVLRTLARMKEEEKKKLPRRAAAVTGLLMIAGLTYLAVVDIPRNFSKDVLNRRIAELDATLATQRKETESLRQSSGEMATQISFLKTDKGAAEAARASAEQQRDVAQQELVAAINAKAEAQSAYDATQRQLAQLQNRLDNTKQITPEQQAAISSINGIAADLKGSANNYPQLINQCKCPVLERQLKSHEYLINLLVQQSQTLQSH